LFIDKIRHIPPVYPGGCFILGGYMIFLRLIEYYVIVRILWRNIYKYIKPVRGSLLWIRSKYENTRYYEWKIRTKVKKKIKKFGKTYIVMGKKGTGKTSYFAWIANNYLKLGIPVYTNFYLKGCYKIDIEDFNKYDIENGVLLYDESGRKLNSRAWNSRQKTKNVEDNSTLGDNIYSIYQFSYGIINAFPPLNCIVYVHMIMPSQSIEFIYVIT
jgi:hypothetical protein